MSQKPVIMITGGGRGIGAATAKLAAARGYAVCVSYVRDGRSAEEVVRCIKSGNGDAIAIQADVASEPDVMSLFRQADSKLGRVSALANNAATLEPQARLYSMEFSRMQRIFAVNV